MALFRVILDVVDRAVDRVGLYGIGGLFAIVR
jgi:hypothetical protein